MLDDIIFLLPVAIHICYPSWCCSSIILYSQ